MCMYGSLKAVLKNLYPPCKILLNVLKRLVENLSLVGLCANNKIIVSH